MARCFVPGCENSESESGKHFFSVPRNERRYDWFRAVGKNDGNISLTRNLVCCQDHFILDSDVEGYHMSQMLLSGGFKTKWKLKKDVLPRMSILNVNLEPVGLSDDSFQPLLSKTLTNPDVLPDEKSSKTIGCQVNVRPKFRSVNLQVRPQTASAECQTDLGRSPPPKVLTASCHNEENLPLKASKGKKRQYDEANNSSSNPSQSSHSDYIPSQKSKASSTSTSVTLKEYSVNEEKSHSCALNLKLMYSNPMYYLGLHKEHAATILNKLQKYSRLSEKKILIALRKVRLNEANEGLSHVFGCSEVYIGRVINEVIPVIAELVKSLIYQPQKDIIKANLPVSFRARYSNVGYIIDCFEIEIEKPTHSVLQSVTWSSYKHCNTLKYLISCTPNGFINFVSVGYGGRASDKVITEASGFLSILTPDNRVMADRGFKHIESMVVKAGSSLVRPPSVGNNEKMTKDEVRQTKVIASLRINVERVIGRLRDYRFLAPHARNHHDLLSLTDSAVIIACAFANLQGPYYK
ncbi:uncharacterized protein [Bemisia tabaci]|uniref:uncharacterized protein n=1 Tax=Bemisia tabaci TaxID=7038 RepID=UPI003B284EB9